MSAEEYDAAVRLSPAVSPLAATGDSRSGLQLLADAVDDARRSFRAHAHSPAGRGELESLLIAARGAASRLDRLARAQAASAAGAAAVGRPVGCFVAVAGCVEQLAAGNSAGSIRCDSLGCAARILEATAARQWWADPVMRRFWTSGVQVPAEIAAVLASPQSHRLRLRQIAQHLCQKDICCIASISCISQMII